MKLKIGECCHNCGERREDEADCDHCHGCGGDRCFHPDNPDAVRIRPMRGQVVIREVPPPPGPRQVRTHRGTVLALGPPARTPRGVEVPYEFSVGDVVQYHFEHLEKLLTNIWSDGLPATWIPQQDVDGVWEAENLNERIACLAELPPETIFRFGPAEHNKINFRTTKILYKEEP